MRHVRRAARSRLPVPGGPSESAPPEPPVPQSRVPCALLECRPGWPGPPLRGSKRPAPRASPTGNASPASAYRPGPMAGRRGAQSAGTPMGMPLASRAPLGSTAQKQKRGAWRISVGCMPRSHPRARPTPPRPAPRLPQDSQGRIHPGAGIPPTRSQRGRSRALPGARPPCFSGLSQPWMLEPARPNNGPEALRLLKRLGTEARAPPLAGLPHRAGQNAGPPPPRPRCDGLRARCIDSVP